MGVHVVLSESAHIHAGLVRKDAVTQHLKLSTCVCHSKFPWVKLVWSLLMVNFGMWFTAKLKRRAILYI